MAYTKTTWVNNQAPAINADNLNKIEDGIYNSVRYADAQSLTDTQKQQARANIAAAQSGFGFGGESIVIIQASGASESHEDYCKKLDAVLNTMANKSIRIIIALPPQLIGYGFFPCILYKGDMNYASLQSVGGYDYHISGFVIRKSKKYDTDPEGTWNPFEYVNPPMQLGVEYRTTERYLGKPVYCKLVDFGTLPNNTTKSVSLNIDNPEYLVGIWGNCDKSLNIPSNNFGGGIAEDSIVAIWTNLSSVYISTNRDRSFQSATILVKYTKTTD